MLLLTIGTSDLIENQSTNLKAIQPENGLGFIVFVFEGTGNALEFEIF